MGPVEVLVANAARARRRRSSTPATSLAADARPQPDRAVPVHPSRAAVDDRAGWGRIVVVASVVAKRGEPMISAYTASKHGVLGLVRSASREVARRRG